MKWTILLPHYKTPKMTAYSVHQFLTMCGRHEIDLIVIDNNAGDGTIDCLKPFGEKVRIFSYPKDRLQSHGISFDWVMNEVRTEYFITVESDSFPTNENWLDYYESLVEQEFVCAGSLLQLSGGQYIHPAGTMYKKSIWAEAKKYCENIEYSYFPNMASSEGFDCHLMVQNKMMDEFLKDPNKFINLAENYKPYSKEKALERLAYYKPVVSPFHNGMGGLQESVNTYGIRNIHQDSGAILLDNNENFIKRIGYEPGQWFCYWMLATGKKIYSIPTKTFWMPNRINQQQERTINECGFVHIWGGSSWKFCDKPDVQDIVKRKEFVENELWESLPDEIKNPS